MASNSSAAWRPEPATTHLSLHIYTWAREQSGRDWSRPGKSKEKAASRRAAGAAEQLKIAASENLSSAAGAPSLPASARLCAAPGSPRARRSCRISRMQRVWCHCGTCERAPRARAAWRTPRAGGARGKAAETGRWVWSPAGRGPGTLV